jgi:DNA-binding response OmpR family regulator
VRPVVLVVDDDDVIRYALVRGLSREYRVVSAASGREAVKVLRRQVPGAILLDMVMCEGDGYAVLTFVKGLRPKPAVIVYSVLDTVGAVVRAMQMGADDYLVKPSDLATVRKSLSSALRPITAEASLSGAGSSA